MLQKPSDCLEKICLYVVVFSEKGKDDHSSRGQLLRAGHVVSIVPALS